MNHEHSHIWTQTTDEHPPAYACASCPASTTGCRDCGRAHESSLVICPRCLTRALALLDDIGTYLRAMSDVARVTLGLRSVRYDLVTTRSAGNVERLDHGLDVVYRETRAASGPSSITTQQGAMDLLEWWVDDWAERSGDPEGAWDTLTYLRDHTVWAAHQHPAWADYLDELRATRAVVRRLAGLAPEPEPAPCVHCGGRVVRYWSEAEGLSDVARCTGCHMTWDTRGAFVAATRAHLPDLASTHRGALVTADQVRGLYPNLNAATWRSWVHRGLLVPADTDGRGRPRFALGDVVDRVEGGAPVAAGGL